MPPEIVPPPPTLPEEERLQEPAPPMPTSLPQEKIALSPSRNFNLWLDTQTPQHEKPNQQVLSTFNGRAGQFFTSLESGVEDTRPHPIAPSVSISREVRQQQPTPPVLDRTHRASIPENSAFEPLTFNRSETANKWRLFHQCLDYISRLEDRGIVVEPRLHIRIRQGIENSLTGIVPRGSVFAQDIESPEEKRSRMILEKILIEMRDVKDLLEKANRIDLSRNQVFLNDIDSYITALESRQPLSINPDQNPSSYFLQKLDELLATFNLRGPGVTVLPLDETVAFRRNLIQLILARETIGENIARSTNIYSREAIKLALNGAKALAVLPWKVGSRLITRARASRLDQAPLRPSYPEVARVDGQRRRRRTQERPASLYSPNPYYEALPTQQTETRSRRRRTQDRPDDLYSPNPYYQAQQLERRSRTKDSRLPDFIDRNSELARNLEQTRNEYHNRPNILQLAIQLYLDDNRGLKTTKTQKASILREAYSFLHSSVTDRLGYSLEVTINNDLHNAQVAIKEFDLRNNPQRLGQLMRYVRS